MLGAGARCHENDHGPRAQIARRASVYAAPWVSRRCKEKSFSWPIIFFEKKDLHFSGLGDYLIQASGQTRERNRNRNPNRNRKMNIKIQPADAALTKYTHAAPESAAQDLAEHIAELEAAGYTVTAATSARASVPNAYRSAYKMCAPVWVYRAEAREIRMISAQLQNRPKGRTIPAHIHIEGSVTPTGYRAYRKGDNSIDLIPA